MCGEKLKYKFKVIFIIVFTFLYLCGVNIISFSSFRGNFPQPESHKNIVENKKVYLTFDDGPSNGITAKILDILLANNVRATFFIVGSQINDRKGILKRIYTEGHGIGLHTYTHKYKTIYRNNDIFIKEMEQTATEIERVIGISPKLIRFPGGSKKRLNKGFEDKLRDLGYKIFDWNIGAGDGFNNNICSDKIFKNCIAKEEKFSRVILLLHCSAENIETVKALPSIIRYYKELGYEFNIIDDKTPEYYYKY